MIGKREKEIEFRGYIGGSDARELRSEFFKVNRKCKV